MDKETRDNEILELFFDKDIEISTIASKYELSRTQVNRIFKYFMRFNWFRKIYYRFKIYSKKLFPSFITKTDEERIQNAPHYLQDSREYILTEKLDGQSLTLYKKGNKYGVCSRNYELIKEDNSSWWTVAKQINYKQVLDKLQKRLSSDLIIIQGEIIGNGIQGNKYKVNGYDFYAFNLIKDNYKYSSENACNILKDYNIKFVPILERYFKLPTSIEEIVEYSKGKSKLVDIQREGIVVRGKFDNKISFKVISPDFLLKYDE